MRLPKRLRIPTMAFTISCAAAMVWLLAASPAAVSGPPSGPGSAHAEAIPWKAVAASGLVEARPATPEEDWQLVRRGDRFQPRTELRTGRQGHATLIRNANVLIVDPSSHVRLPADPSDGTVIQNSGSVVYEVEDGKAPDFRVLTPYLVAGVKGTVFMVTVTDSYVAVSVEEGVVEVTSRATGEAVDVEAGETVRLDARESAEMERVSLQARRNRESPGIRKETRRLAHVEQRRLERVHAEWNDRLLEGDPLIGNRAGSRSPVGVKNRDGNDRDTLLDATDIEKQIDQNVDDLGVQEDELSQDQVHQDAVRNGTATKGGG